MSIGMAKDTDPGTIGGGRLGFSLVELMIAVGLFGLVMAGSFGVYNMCQRMWRSTSLSMDSARIASLALERMVYGVGNGSGLRAAAGILVDTNKHKDSTSVNYWDTKTNSPPAANNPANNFCWSTSPAYNDGSWRIIYSNSLDGVKYIDYIKKQRSIVMWLNTNDAASRVLICNYVLSASVYTVSNGAGPAGIVISNLTVWKKDGTYTASNRVSTFVKSRNK